MKIYTRTGDEGKTGLIGGQRVLKTDPRMAACGEVDELNAVIGWTVVTAPAQLASLLSVVQDELFHIGAALATPPKADHGAHAAPNLNPASISRLETEIDAAVAKLPPLKNFILPGGCECAARLHLARTVCRRAERAVIQLHQHEPVLPTHLQYLNRLSDWLFVYARLANQLAGTPDIVWRLT